MNTHYDRSRLLHLIDYKVLKLTDEPFTLSTGQTSRFYFDCKTVTLDGEGLSLIASAFLAKISEHFSEAIAIGGLTMGADFIAAAVAMKGYESDHKLRYGSIVRKETKKHGTKNKIENQLPEGTSIVVIDDVITSGESTKKACIEFIEAGYEIAGIIVLIDREQGGKENLEQSAELEGVTIKSIFKRSEFSKIKEHEQQHGSTIATA